MGSTFIALFAVSMLVAISPLLYLLVDAIIDIRRCKKRYMQNQEEIDEILDSSMINHRK